MTFRKNNHYVSRGYLKRFALWDGKVATYRILVSDEKVRLWKKSSTRGIATHSHLYTRLAGGKESDEIEEWLGREFEAPAEEALQKANTDVRLAPLDWKRLIRFVAAQDVRTPARLVEDLQRWNATVPDTMKDSMQKSIRKLDLAQKAGEVAVPREHPDAEYLPFRVTTEIRPDEAYGTVKGETISGRGLWVFSIRHLLKGEALSALESHKWSIVKLPEDMNWFTSDNPVVRLNFHGADRYDFRGGWGSTGTEILFPLGPRHLLYTRIGEKPPTRGTVIPREQAWMIRRFIAEQAHRFIFAASPDAEVPKLRPRKVDAAILRSEQEQWRSWHEDQTKAERELMGWSSR